MKTVAAAPGKIVLLGEYAVLFGAPALVMSVNRRARVEIVDVATPGLEIIAPDVSPQPCHFTLDEQRLLRCQQGESAAQPLALVTSVIHALLAAGIIGPEMLKLRLTLDTSAFFWTDENGRRDKLGLGSSAALTVALASGLAAHAGRDELFEDADFWLQQLLAFHRQFQHGKGSGIDIAASLYGGVSRFQLDAARSAHTEPCQWPKDVHRMAIWSGQSASTPRFLEAIDAWSNAEPEAFQSAFGQLGLLAETGVNAASSQNSDLLLATVANFGECLQKIGDAAKIPIMTSEHARIRSLAQAAGCEYKPCGAGGGDLGIALSKTPGALERLREALATSMAGSNACPIMDLEEDPEGLRIMMVEHDE